MRPDLSNEERRSICVALLKECKANGKTKRGTISAICTQFNVSRATVWRLWKQAQVTIASNNSIEVNTKKPGNVGRKQIEIDPSIVLQLPLHRRTNIRTMGKAIGMSKSTLGRRIKEGVIGRHTNAIKPHLTNENKKGRLRWCLSMIDKNSPMHNPLFSDMYDYIHIDEKWFYISKEIEKYYLLPAELEPLRSCKSKRFITKVMFLAAVARPRFDPMGGTTFSGKLGIFPFVYKEPAKRNSKNRIAGTLETKAVVSVTKEVVKAYLIEKLLPAICQKWPESTFNRTIYIQQDNAKPHIKVDDADFEEAAASCGVNVKLVCQPPNSPDMNVLDLGFFRAIQSLQQQESMRNIDELVAVVEKAFEELPSKSLNNVFVTYQLCMLEVMKSEGCNGYKIPHVNKSRLMRKGNIPTQVHVPPELVNATEAYLQD